MYGRIELARLLLDNGAEACAEDEVRIPASIRNAQS
jgi:hypothetical protein